MSRDADPWGKHWSLASDAGIGHASEDIAAYLSPEIYAAECEKIFRRTWLIAGRVSEIPRPGDYIKREIYPLKAEVIVVLGKDDRIRAFHNACAHRGSALVRDCAGSKKLFVCPYHAWSFDTEGRCRGITGAEFFPQLDRDKIGLAPVHAEVWNGFVFVNLDTSPMQSLSEFLGGMGDLYGDIPFDAFTHGVEIVQDFDTNWKCFLDAFLEGYHAPFVHHKTGPMFVTRGNPHNVFYDGRFLGAHSSFIVQSNPDWVPTGDVLKFVYGAAGASVVGDQSNNAAQGAATMPSDHRGMNSPGLPQYGLRIVNLFPMTQILILSNRFQVGQFWPLAHNRTRFVVRVYTAPPTRFCEEFAEAHMTAGLRDLLTEDVAMTQLQYKGMHGRGREKVFFGDNEVGIRFAHQMIQKYLEDRVPA